MFVVGLTGGIGSGKSTIASFFQELGVPVYDSDSEAKKLMHSQELMQELKAAFGAEVYKDDSLNKNWLSQKVFSDKKALDKLNSIVHPAVRDHFLRWARSQEFPYVIQETALIFEQQTQDLYAMTLLVTAPEETRIQRVIDRSGWDKEKVLARMAAQWSDEKKAGLATDILENLDLQVSQRRVEELHKKYLKAATRTTRK